MINTKILDLESNIQGFIYYQNKNIVKAELKHNNKVFRKMFHLKEKKFLIIR